MTRAAGERSEASYNLLDTNYNKISFNLIIE
jgi:hypothetical protein